MHQLAQGRGVLEALHRQRLPGARAEQPGGRDEAGERQAVLAEPGDAGLDAAGRLALRQGPELAFAAGVDAAGAGDRRSPPTRARRDGSSRAAPARRRWRAAQAQPVDELGRRPARRGSAAPPAASPGRRRPRRRRRACACRQPGSTARRRAGRRRRSARSRSWLGVTVVHGFGSSGRRHGRSCERRAGVARRTPPPRGPRAGAGSGRAGRAAPAPSRLASARARAARRCAAPIARQQRRDRLGERRAVPRSTARPAAAVGQLGQAFGLAHDDRRAAGHRLERRQAEGLLVAGVDEGLGAGQDRRQRGRRRR